MGQELSLGQRVVRVYGVRLCQSGLKSVFLTVTRQPTPGGWETRRG